MLISDGDEVEVDGSTGQSPSSSTPMGRTGRLKASPVSETIASVDEIAPARAVGICGAGVGPAGRATWRPG